MSPLADLSAVAPSDQPLKVFQFWDKPIPPLDVSELMKSWSSDSSFAYERFDLQTADKLIADHFDEEVLSTFRQCAIPAMQADFFRYCVLYVKGGIYIDADTKNGGGLPEVILEHAGGRGLLMERQKKIANDFIFLRNAQDPLVEAAISIAVSNIVARVSNNVWEVTGPGIFTALKRDPASAALFEGLSILSVVEVRKQVLFQWDLPYKSGAEDWRSPSGKWRSIFKEPSA